MAIRIIDIPDDVYKDIEAYNQIPCADNYTITKAILNSKALPDNATNGDAIKSLIPKADYENRLKSDLEAILEELDLEVGELASHFADGRIVYRYQLHNLIQQKINTLNSKCEGCEYHMNKPCDVCKSCINGNRYQRKAIY